MNIARICIFMWVQNVCKPIKTSIAVHTEVEQELGSQGLLVRQLVKLSNA